MRGWRGVVGWCLYTGGGRLMGGSRDPTGEMWVGLVGRGPGGGEWVSLGRSGGQSGGACQLWGRRGGGDTRGREVGGVRVHCSMYRLRVD